MKTKIARSFTTALFTLVAFFAARQCALAQFPPLGDDNTPSMGQFRILVTTNFQALMIGYPAAEYNPVTHLFTSPVLYDGNTIIGRSNPLHDGDASDLGGVPVGTAGTLVSESTLSVQPGGLGPVGTREVHTQIRAMNMKDFGGSVAAVRGGTNAVGRPVSGGEVESYSGAGGMPANDFPARSFFDVFAQVDVPGGGSFPGATNLYNDLPLLVLNTNVTSFPPQVIYIHGVSTAVPIKFSNNNPPLWTNGQIFGLLMLAGHDVVKTNDAASQQQLVNTLNAQTPPPVEPQYSNLVGAPVTIAGTNMLFPAKGDDITTSLGTFTLVVNPAFQPFLSGYPFYNPTTKRLTSPLLFDQSTKIGRSASVLEDSAIDTNGVLVGTANTLVRDNSFTLIPPLFEAPSNTIEVHTEVRTLNLAGGGAAVRAGTAAPGSPGSYGEVQSLSGPSGDPYWDFPAKSFFDVWVQVDFPPGGLIPAAFTVTNTQALVVQNQNVTTFPPTVIYVHGNSSAVPVAFTTTVPAIGANAGDIFGILTLAGHGVGYSEGTASQQQFQQAVAQMTEEPVAPQYATWAPGLAVPLQIGGITIQSGGTVQISGFCTPNATLKLQSTTSLIGGPVWVDEVTTTGTTNSTFIVAPPVKSTASVKFYRMVDNTR